MNPKALLSTFITLAFIFPAAGIVFRKVFVICMKIFIFIDFSNAPEGFRDKMRGLFNKSLDILTKVNFKRMIFNYLLMSLISIRSYI